MIFQIHNSPNHTPLPLKLELVGIDHRQEPIRRPGGMPFYQWFYCVKGQGEFIVNSQRSVISEGQGLLIYPQVPHIYQALAPDWTVHFFGFGGSICHELLSSLEMHETGVYHFSRPEVFARHIQKLHELRQQAISGKMREYSKECYAFLLDLSPCITRINPSSHVDANDLITELILYMEHHYDRDISLDELAQLVGLSREYMCSLFKKTMKQTIMHYLLTIRISRAREFLIRFPEKKILEIAKMCGFESPSYFGKKFKLETGMTPDAFRKKLG